jgi:hypothetical protein
MWTNEERLKSSTWRELKAVVLTLKGFSDHFQNKFVKLFTDNQVKKNKPIKNNED